MNPLETTTHYNWREIRQRVWPLLRTRAVWRDVLQYPFLFDTTIEAKLRLIRPDLSEAELIRVLQQGAFDGLLAAGGHFARLYAIATTTSTQRIKIKEAGFA